MSADPKGDFTLDDEAKKWASKVAKENRSIREYSKMLRQLLTQSIGNKVRLNFIFIMFLKCGSNFVTSVKKGFA